MERARTSGDPLGHELHVLALQGRQVVVRSERRACSPWCSAGVSLARSAGSVTLRARCQRRQCARRASDQPRLDDEAQRQKLAPPVDAASRELLRCRAPARRARASTAGWARRPWASPRAPCAGRRRASPPRRRWSGTIWTALAPVPDDGHGLALRGERCGPSAQSGRSCPRTTRAPGCRACRGRLSGPQPDTRTRARSVAPALVPTSQTPAASSQRGPRPRGCRSGCAAGCRTCPRSAGGTRGSPSAARSRASSSGQGSNENE